MKLIVGLGNPGKKYEATRHNVGFMAIDALADKLNINVNKAKFKGLYGDGRIGMEKVYLLKPETYMNNSGESIRALIDFYKIDVDDVYVIYDDMDLEVGQLKIKPKGGSGGHNGLKSIEAHLGTKQYKRFRIGIGKDKHMLVVDYVLGRFGKRERKEINEVIDKVCDAVEDFNNLDFNGIMTKYN
jgi:PTH1 family peptidyl-tRNA hydrolase